MDPVKNFAKVQLTQGYAAGAVSVVLETGNGAKLPSPATEGAFNLVWWNATDYGDPADDPYVEIVRCTARSTDTLTITRAQEGTSDNNHNIAEKTYKMLLGVTKKTIDENIKKLGGDGSDGALAISAGTTTLDLGGAAIFVKNYTSISITGSGKLAFSNPHDNGTLIILKSLRDVILTSTTEPLIDVSALGGKHGVSTGESGKFGITSEHPSPGGKGSSSKGGGGGTSMVNNGGVSSGDAATETINVTRFFSSIAVLLNRTFIFGCGGGGGQGGTPGTTIRGRGGAGLLIECGDSLNFTGKIWAKGEQGSSGTGSHYPGGGGGGGTVAIVVSYIIAESGTIIVSGGAGGTADGTGGVGGNGDFIITTFNKL